MLSSTQPTTSFRHERSSFSSVVSSQDLTCCMLSFREGQGLLLHAATVLYVSRLGRPQITAPERCASHFARLNEAQKLSFCQICLMRRTGSCKFFGLRVFEFEADREGADYVRRSSDRKPYCLATRNYADFWLSSRQVPIKCPHENTVAVSQHPASSSVIRFPPSSCFLPVWTRSLIAAKRSPRLFKVLPGRRANLRTWANAECGHECLSGKEQFLMM